MVIFYRPSSSFFTLHTIIVIRYIRKGDINSAITSKILSNNKVQHQKPSFGDKLTTIAKSTAIWTEKLWVVGKNTFIDTNQNYMSIT